MDLIKALKLKYIKLTKCYFFNLKVAMTLSCGRKRLKYRIAAGITSINVFFCHLIKLPVILPTLNADTVTHE